MQAWEFINWLKKKPPIFWLLQITVLYVIWQISLSGAILSASSMEASDRLASVAQKTVGFGMALFVFRVLFMRLYWPITVAIAIFCGFMAMWGEEAIVDWCADRATAEARMDAKKIQIFSSAMLEKKATLADLNPAISENSIKLRAFAKILGLAIWNNPELVAQLDASLGQILNALYGEEAYRKIDAGYKDYAKAWEEAHEKIVALNSMLAKINFARYARDMNSQLGVYAACATEECRNNLNRRVAGYLRQSLPELEITLNLEDFCRIEKQATRYVVGRMSGSREQKICSTDEKRLHIWLKGKLGEKMRGAFKKIEDMPAALRDKMLDGEFVSLADWRAMWQKEIDTGIEARLAQEFGEPVRFAPGGDLASEGKAYAVSVFLPPVALGFSITVCFMHLASLATALTRKPAICAGVAFVCWLAPAFFATSVPLHGLAGIYGRWLVFWEGWLYPFGILRWLMP